MSLSELWSLYGQNYIDALLATWGMTLESFAIAMVLAVAVTVMRVSPLKPLRVFGDLYVQVFRNIPGIALLIIVVYALPPLKVVLPYRTCVIVATVLLGSAFGSENFMSGINTVGVGQVEAARSLGMSYGQTMKFVIVPQAFRRMLPPLGNEAIMLLKDSSLVSAIGLAELAFAARTVAGVYSRYWEPYLTISLVYLVLTLAMAAGVNWLEKRYQIAHHR